MDPQILWTDSSPPMWWAAGCCLLWQIPLRQEYLRDCREALLNEQFICSQQSLFFRPRRQVLIVRRDISAPPLPLFFLWLFSSPSSHPPTLPPAIRNWIWSRTIHLVSLSPSIPLSLLPHLLCRFLSSKPRLNLSIFTWRNERKGWGNAFPVHQVGSGAWAHWCV